MALHHNPRIVTQGFHIHVDPADTNCYPGSGTAVGDLSGNGRTMTLLNGASIVNGVFVLDGSNDYVNYGYGGIFDWTAIPWTVSFWANPSSFTWISAIDLINAGNGHFRFDVGNGFIQALFRTPGGSSSALTRFNTSINTGKWYCCAFTRSGTTYSSYLNGILGNTKTNTTLTNSTAMSVIRIGYSADNDAADRTFQGSIGPVTLYERTLTASEIKQNYLSQKSRFGL